MSATHVYYAGDTPGLSGKYRYSCGGRGTLGSLIPSTGDSGPSYLFASLSLPADANKEYFGVIGTLPAGLALAVDDNGSITAAANDGTYVVPFDLYESAPGAATVKLGSTSFTLNYGIVAATINLVGANSTQSSTSSTGAATVTHPAVGTVNLVGTNASQTSTSSTGAATVTQAAKTVSLIGGNSTQVNASSTGTATATHPTAPTGWITVPDSRTAVFVAKSRIAVFTGTAPVTMQKGALDQVYIVADVTKDLTDGGTTIASVAPLVAPLVTGVTVLEGPSIQGGLIVLKLGALDTTPRAVNSITYRVTCANGEVFDRTLILTAFDDKSQVFGKDPDDRRFYAFDFSADLALSNNTSIASVQAPTAVGVSALSVPALQGGQAVLLIGGLDLSNNAVNSCLLVVTLGTGEVLYRTIYFSRQDH